MSNPPVCFLSPSVRYVLVGIAEEFDKTLDPIGSCITNHLTLDWEKMCNVLDHVSENFNLHDEPTEWFTTNVRKLWPVFHSVHQGLAHSTLSFPTQLCNWTGRQLDIQHYYKKFRRGGPTATLEVVLYLTSLMERSLGNVFLLKGHNVPFLLRDLLATSELQSVLGPTPSLFLQLLMGSPRGMNLRNIAWHGFPRPDELRPELGSMLFVLIASLGELLAHVGTLPHRPQVSNLAQQSELLRGCFFDMKGCHIQTREVLLGTPHIATSHQVYWDVIFEHYLSNRYGDCLVLLLPQLEHLLRSVFCSANDCPERALTAQSTVFYTTLDDILAPTVSGEQNRVVNVLGTPLVEMLQDMFMHPAGPRIRDKLSHGECDLDSIPQVLINHMLGISLVIVLATNLEKKQLLGAISTNKQDDQYELCIKQKGFPLEEMLVKAENYTSKFHISALLKVSVLSGIKRLEQWKLYPKPDSTEDFTYMKWEEALDTCQDLTQLQHDLLMKCLPNVAAELQDAIHICNVETIHRPKCEGELLTVLRQIADKVGTTCDHVEEALMEKFRLYNARKLRSRQRETYRRQLVSLPCIHAGINCIIRIIIVELHTINKHSDEDHIKIRFLKQVLQYMENIASCVDSQKNRWDEAIKLTHNFCLRIRKSHYLIKIK